VGGREVRRIGVSDQKKVSRKGSLLMGDTGGTLNLGRKKLGEAIQQLGGGVVTLGLVRNMERVLLRRSGLKRDRT